MGHTTQIPPETPLCTFSVLRLAYGKSQILTNFPPLQQTRVIQVFYCCAVLNIKLAVLLEFLRIFSPKRSNNSFWICHILIWLNFLFYVIIAFIYTFPCQPIERFWKRWIGGRCLNTATVNLVAACFNSASDLSLLIAPQKLIWNLQTSFKRRLGVSAIFLVGFW